MKIVIAIPARNEAALIGACIRAIGHQRRPRNCTVALAIAVNNSFDDTAGVARRAAAFAGLPVHVSEFTLPPHEANAGHARAAALALAASQAGPGDIIASTDADSRPASGWLIALHQAISAGADAVFGVVTFDPREAGPAVCAIRAREAHYSALQAEIIARTHPKPHDPWPNHIWAWGANFAVTGEALARVGGCPRVELAEDRAFAAALVRIDARIRHSLAARVLTSRRCEGRAPGGLADLVRIYAQDESYPCDAELEAAEIVWRRAAALRRFEALHGTPGCVIRLARLVGIAPVRLGELLGTESVGSGFAAIEAESSRLGRRRLYPFELAREIARAERILMRLRPAELRHAPPMMDAALWHGIAAQA